MADPVLPPPNRFTVSPESLRWGTGLFCSVLGAFVLVAPHRFAAPPYEALAPYRTLWGSAAFAAGVALLAVAVLRPRPWMRLVVHSLVGAVFLLLAASFAQEEVWTGMVSHGLFGLTTALAGFLPPERTVPRGLPGRDLFALVMSLIAVLNGTLFLLAPAFLGPYYDIARGSLAWLGGILLAGGLLLGAVQLRRPDEVPRAALWAAHLLAGAAFLVNGAVLALPRRSWSGLFVAFGGGLALALLPWLSRRLARIDTASLRTRLALALATAASVALVLAVAVTTTQEERQATEQVLEMRQAEAQSIARHIADYVDLSSARTAAIAAMAGRLPGDPAACRVFLERSLPLYPDVAGLVWFDLNGQVLAASGNPPLDGIAGRSVVAAVRRSPRSSLQLLAIPGEAEERLLLTTPVIGLDGRLAGALVMVAGADALAQRIERPESDVHLADGFGRIIAQRELSPFRSLFGELPAGWDRAVLRGEMPAGGRLAAFASVPDLGWVVAVERPRRSALAGVRRGRDLAFLLLLGMIPVAVLFGIVAARRIARPLRVLARAVGQMANQDPGAPGGPMVAPEPTEITEVARLSSAFVEMRGRLAERTRESQRLATELSARAEALAESDRRKNEFLAMLGHELRNPLGAIANAAHVLQRIGPDDAPARRSVEVIQRQIQHLVRLVDDLLDVSRITRGKVELRRERMDLRDAVRHAAETLRPVVEAKDHELRVSLPAEPLPLDADVTRLEQVVGNLLRNAAKYTDAGGRIDLEARSEGQEAVVLVRDNGMGISPELLPRMFDLFIQGEQGLDRTGAGLGIGLTLVRSLVEMHGGRVQARSEGAGRGSEFEVRLPLSTAPPPPP
ncbi:MAG TPA: sensor histidine kinase [Thermoanaerobaculia bacterium]|nr:sensor histidine kinase [Thermoanaerobaculia bacterium]